MANLRCLYSDKEGASVWIKAIPHAPPDFGRRIKKRQGNFSSSVEARTI